MKRWDIFVYSDLGPTFGLFGNSKQGKKWMDFVVAVICHFDLKVYYFYVIFPYIVFAVLVVLLVAFVFVRELSVSKINSRWLDRSAV